VELVDELDFGNLVNRSSFHLEESVWAVSGEEVKRFMYLSRNSKSTLVLDGCDNCGTTCGVHHLLLELASRWAGVDKDCGFSTRETTLSAGTDGQT
jgi:hypothetical protein